MEAILMPTPLSGLTWLQRAAYFDQQAEAREREGDTRRAELARLNAASMRLLAAEEGDVVPQEVYS